MTNETDLDLPSLRAAAEAATQGVWTCKRGEIYAGEENIACVYRTEAWSVGEPVEHEDQANARYIAACSPARILALVAMVEAQAEEIKRMEGGWHPTHRHVKRGGDYQLVTQAILQTSGPLADNELVQVYIDAGGQHWVRSYHEFHHGRFVEIPAPPDAAP